MMSGTGINEKEYSCSVSERFSSAGKLFLVDYSKSCAAARLLEILKNKDARSFLLVAENPSAADDFAKILAPALEGFEVVRSAAELYKLLGVEKNAAQKDLRAAAAKLTAKHANVIISAVEGDGKGLFNCTLCKNHLKNGAYAGNEVSMYCVSDLLAECAFEFVVIDNVYGMFKLEQLTAEALPTEHDRVDFCGSCYYSSTELSYGRLSALVASASKRIIMSDVVMNDSLVEFYAVLKCLDSDFSLVKARASVQGMARSYDDDCETVYADICFCTDDDSLLSACLGQNRGLKGRLPTDISSMKKYLEGNLHFMSVEEVCLRAISAITELDYNGVYPGIEQIFEKLEGEPIDTAKYFCRMFFADSLKGRIESIISSAKVAKATPEELKSLMDIFNEYGAYHCLDGKQISARVIRLKRDNSGFERFIRDRFEKKSEEEYTYSIISAGDDVLYKCMTVARLVDGKEAHFGFRLPALVICDDTKDVSNSLAKMLGGKCKLTYDIRELENASEGEKLIAIANSSAVRSSAVSLRPATAVLFNVPYLVTELKLLLSKLMSYGDVNAFIIASYGSFDGHVADALEDAVLEDFGSAPLNSSEIVLENETYAQYDELVARIGEMYGLLSRMVKNGCPEDIKEAFDTYNKILTDYNLKINVPAWEMLMDIEYIARLGRSFELIFGNSASVGDDGERLVRQVAQYVKKAQKKMQLEESEVIEKKRFFNVCEKMLRGDCDLKTNTCADCEDYVKYCQNSYEKFKAAVTEFFAMAEDYNAKMDKDIRTMLNTATISDEYSQHRLNALELERDELSARRSEAQQALADIDGSANDCTELFYTDCDTVDRIRSLVYDTYCTMLDKYYSPLLALFGQATNIAISGYNAASDSDAAKGENR